MNANGRDDARRRRTQSLDTLVRGPIPLSVRSDLTIDATQAVAH